MNYVLSAFMGAKTRYWNSVGWTLQRSTAQQMAEGEAIAKKKRMTADGLIAVRVLGPDQI